VTGKAPNPIPSSVLDAVARGIGLQARVDRPALQRFSHWPIEFLPKQAEFMAATEREVGYSGAFGAGKTRALAYKSVQRASVPGARELLCRKHLVTLKATTLRTLLDGDGDQPPVLRQGTYSHNKSDKIIRLHDGGEIVYFGLDDPEKIGSYNGTGCGIDEAVELTEEDYRQLRGRVRLRAPGLERQIYWACNPGAPGHHLAQRFGIATNARATDPALAATGTRVVFTRALDNHFLPDDYRADLETFTGLARSRYVEGLWVGSEGLIYDRFDRTVHVMDREGPWAATWLGVDDGYSNPYCALLVRVDGDGRIHVEDEDYCRQLLMAEKCERMTDMVARYGLNVAELDGGEVDPAAAELRAEMLSRGIPASPAENEVLDGIARVQQRMSVLKDGKPRLTISPRCTNLIRELGLYEWMEGKDKPRKEHDHAPDALRYVEAAISVGGIGVYGI